jgi:Xaa-Pro aminopeptidase
MSESSALQPFGFEERDRRWRRTREEMAKRNVDVLIAAPPRTYPGDAVYLANRMGPVIFPLAGDPIFVNPRPLNNVPASFWIQDVRAATTTGTTAVPVGAAIAAILRDLNVGRKRVAVAGIRGGGPYTYVRQPEGNLNYTTMEEIKAALPDAEIVDGTPILSEARYVKSEAEIAVLQRSVDIGEAAIDAMIERAHVGVPIADVYAEMIVAQIRHGAEPHVGWGAGPWGKPLERTVGAPDGVLTEGWVIKNEVEPNVIGYTCQVDQPAMVGPIDPEAQELFDLGKTAFETACRTMKPGATWRQVWTEAKKAADGKTYAIEFLMHGRGLGDEGPMFIPTDDHEAHPLADDPVRENTVFILKPYAYKVGGRRDDWTNGFNVTWGDTVRVTPNGAVRMGRRPQVLVSVS